MKRTEPITSPGRPPVYEEDYCKEAVRFMCEGKSIVQLAAHLGVARQTIYDWAGTHDEFKEALNIARSASQAWWEETYDKAALGKIEGVIPSMMIFKMKQFNWSDKQEHRVIEKKLPATDKEVADILDKAEK